MNKLWNIDMKELIKKLLIIFYSLAIFYLSYFKKISTLYSTILFIVLGTILIIRNWPGKHDPLFKAMNNDDLNKFKEYLLAHNLKVSNIHKFEYISKKTPIIYAIQVEAFNIFKYLLENDYNLNYVSKNISSEPAIAFAAHSGKIEFLNLLLKYKDKFDLYAKSNKFKANALEIAVWRGRENKAHIEALINAGMKFSIQEYNKTWVGESIPFDKVDMDVKKVLMKKFVFDKVINQLNIVDEIDKKEKINFFEKIKIYWREYLDFA